MNRQHILNCICNRISNILLVSLASVYLTPIFTCSAQSAEFANVTNSDLAIILPAELDSKLSILAQDTHAPNRFSLFESAWYDALRRAFAQTSIGPTLDIENDFEDWRLVSLRIVPCSPFGDITSYDPNIYCWPEVRQVWQPIQKNVNINGHINTAFADDRAVHALYDLTPESVLLAEVAASATQLLAKAKKQTQSNTMIMTQIELNTFAKLRNKMSSGLMRALVSLRDSTLNTVDYKAFGPRPEFGQPPYRAQAQSVAFKNRLILLLQKYTPTTHLKELTAFSLPEGRQPPLLDEWVFLKFNSLNGNISQSNIQLKSSNDGRVLFDFGKSASVSQRRDDPRLDTVLDSSALDPISAAEIRSRVVLQSSDNQRLQEIISNRQFTRVSNTSCGSCHKFNSDKFDLHNLSYLDDRAMALTPRVRKDIELDLSWIKENL